MAEQSVCLSWAKKPSLEENPVNGYPVKEGRNLPFSDTEEILGFSIRREYSPKQLRRIRRLKSLHGTSNSTVYGHGISNRLRASVQSRKSHRSRKLLVDLGNMEMEK